MNDLPPDPFGPEEELISAMGYLRKLHSAALAAGFSENAAIQFIIGLFSSMMASAQNSTQKKTE